MVFGAGDGHDQIERSGDAFEWDSSNFDWISPELDPWGVEEIYMPDLTSEDFIVLWDAAIQFFEPANEVSGSYALVGDMALKIKATGDTIFLGNVAGWVSNYSQDGTLEYIENHPEENGFSAEYLPRIFNGSFHPTEFEFGPVSPGGGSGGQSAQMMFSALDQASDNFETRKIGPMYVEHFVIA